VDRAQLGRSRRRNWNLGCRSSIRSAPLFHPTSLDAQLCVGNYSSGGITDSSCHSTAVFLPECEGGTATATSSTGRTKGNKFRPVLFMVHRFRMLSSQAFRSISFVYCTFVFGFLKRKTITYNTFVCQSFCLFVAVFQLREAPRPAKQIIPVPEESASRLRCVGGTLHLAGW
jgi:hypothetical protein